MSWSSRRLGSMQRQRDLRLVARLQDLVDEELLAQVGRACEAGAPWAEIGLSLGATARREEDRRPTPTYGRLWLPWRPSARFVPHGLPPSSAGTSSIASGAAQKPLQLQGNQSIPQITDPRKPQENQTR